LSAAELFTLLGGSAGGTAIGFCVLLITGVVVPKWVHVDVRAQRDEWKKTAELNAARADAAVLAGQIAKDLMVGLRKELE